MGQRAREPARRGGGVARRRVRRPAEELIPGLRLRRWRSSRRPGSGDHRCGAA
jgi:hypothetical protein